MGWMALVVATAVVMVPEPNAGLIQVYRHLARRHVMDAVGYVGQLEHKQKSNGTFSDTALFFLFLFLFPFPIPLLPAVPHIR